LLTIAGDQTAHSADSIVTGCVYFKGMSGIAYKQAQKESIYRNIMVK
jgi:hypothetical protein